MKNALMKLISGVFILAFISCAPVKFYSNAEMTKKSGLKYYTVKPILQVERDPSNNSIVKATIIYLPDLEPPQYIVMRDGLGSRKLDLKLSEGSINTFGLDTDPKIAETITALSGLVSKTTSAITDLSKIKSVLPPATSATVTELYDIIMQNGLTSVKRIEIR
jgi:hypothetical protein